MTILLRKSDLNLFIYFITIFTQVFTINYENAGLLSYLKYFVCVIGIIYSFSILLSGFSNQRIMKKETKGLLLVPLVFLLISLIKIGLTQTISSRIVNELMFLVLPILYAYGLINTLQYRQIEKAIFGTLIISFVGYIMNVGLNPIAFARAITSMNFSASESLLESSQFAGTAIAVSLYYIYYRKNKIGLVLSVLFVVFTFKRLAIVTVIVLLFLPKFVDLTGSLKKNTFRFICVFVFIVGVVYFQMMLPDNKEFINQLFGGNFDAFTKSRYWRFSLIYNHPSFVNYGLGSTFDFLMERYNFSLEMDICKLLIEVGYIAVFIFIRQYFNAVKENRYCTILMGYLFLNMITSHCLASMFTWLIVYITIGTIQFINPDGVKPDVKIK